MNGVNAARELVDLRIYRQKEHLETLTTFLDIHTEKGLESDLRKHLVNCLERRREKLKDIGLYEIEVAPAAAKSQPRKDQARYFRYVALEDQ
jgi:hypothetical protein